MPGTSLSLPYHTASRHFLPRTSSVERGIKRTRSVASLYASDTDDDSSSDADSDSDSESSSAESEGADDLVQETVVEIRVPYLGIKPFPRRWQKMIHHDGSLYFYHRVLRVLTTENIYDAGTRKAILKIRNEQLSLLDAENTADSIPYDWEMYIMCSEGPVCEYISETYCFAFAHLGRQGVRRLPQSHFWSIFEKFPMHRNLLSIHAEVAFLEALTYGANERVMDRKNTTFPFTDEQAVRLVQIYRHLKDRRIQSGDSIVPALGWHIARVMRHIEHSRERYGFATREARIYRDIAHPKLSWKVWAVDTVLLFLLLGAHTAYRKRLQSTRIKGTVYMPDFHTLMESLLKEWADTNLLATVFITANIGFLAVPDVNSLQRTASLASSLFSVMSIVAGVHHVWQHRGKTDVEFKDAHKYLHHVDRLGPELDLTVTACFLSLPLVALLWSILFFTVAVGAFSFSTSPSSSDTAKRVFLTVVLTISMMLAMGMLLFFWSIWRKPRTNEIEEDWSLKVLPRVDKKGWTAVVRAWAMKLSSRKTMDVKSAAEEEVIEMATSPYKRPRLESDVGTEMFARESA
ncbi:hypothetical protein PLICRDRAFT_33372 [Plicaturopsis crispa FD-325 SS-3]|nr:hypothetical protein PLICRDRAFT_33372 [Plicaturopsis crispa FD-325 SS-3]